MCQSPPLALSLSPSPLFLSPPPSLPLFHTESIPSSKAPCACVSWTLSPPLNGNPDPLPRHIEAPFPLQVRTLRSLGQALHVFSAPSCPPPLGSASARLGPAGLFSVVTRQGPGGRTSKALPWAQCILDRKGIYNELGSLVPRR